MRRLSCISMLLAAILMGVSDVRAEQVVFSEVMYHPPGTLPEYIEVYNNTATPFDIAEWRMSNGVEYVFPSFSAADASRTFLKPFERIVLSGVDEATLRSAYSMAATVRVYGPWTGNLKNAGERITLQDKNGVVVCTVKYDGRWFPAADGAGHSLVLKNPDKAIDDWRNWIVSRTRGGTPGSEEVQETETAVASPEVNLAVGIPFVNYGDVWRFNDKSVDLGTAWCQPAFDDSAWQQGPGLLGFETATLPSPGIQTAMAAQHQLTYYLRKTFVYNGGLTGVTMTVDQVLDDGAVYYLNGHEIGRSGMAVGTVTFTTTASRVVSDAVEELGVITADGSALVNGTNVLAAEVHQCNTTSSDIVFGMRLNISAPSQPSLLINEVLPGPAGVGFVEIYNPGASPVNLRDHYLTDDPANLRKSRVATDLVVTAGGLASVGFTESGLAVTSPVKVYLTAPDGVTVINAISSAMPLDGRSLGRKPTGSSSWFLFSEPTRDMPNSSQSGLAAAIHLNEVHFNGSKTVDWVEFYNSGNGAISLNGLFLCVRADLSDKVAISGSVPARGHASGDFAFPFSDGEVTLLLVNASDTVLSAAGLTRPTLGDTLQAFPDGSGEWYASAASTRDAANNPARNTDIVINEIMYDPPSNEWSAEFIELYNRGTTAVGLSGWRFVEGIDFAIPAGTVIPPDGYLVVAGDAEWMRATYGDIPVVGDWSGHLSNHGERVRLVDQWGNLADEVDYLAGGNWPDLAAGGGSSMELQNPGMDNSLASAWADSDESGKTSFQHYSISDVYRQLTTLGAVTDYKELYLYLVGDSHVVLKNIQVREKGTGSNLIVHGGEMSTDGHSASGWLAQGTHYASFMDGGEFHVVSEGHGDNRPNRVEIDVTAMQANHTYEISFDVRWVSGTSRLIVQTWDHSIAASISLPVPANLGSPGFENSRFSPEPAPQLDGLMHSPAVPAPGQTVRVTVHVLSQRPTPKVLLYHRLDNAYGNGAWASRPMVDDGATGGDEQAGDGIYTTQLTEYGQSGQVVQFYVLAYFPGSDLGQLPKEGGDRPALYVVDTPMGAGDLRRVRFVVSALDLRTLADGDSPTAPYGYAFPRLSNHYYNMTMIVNEKDVIYGCEIRENGSPWTRGGDLLQRGKLHFPKDNLFRGKTKMTYDYDNTGSSLHHDRLVHYWLYLLGHPANESEYIQLKVNNNGPQLREEIEPVWNDMLDRVYANGSQGELYRIDDEWWFTDDWNRTSRNADWSYKDTDNPGRYRTEWIKRTRENEDDYSSLISFFKKVYANAYTQAEIERLIDPVATMKMDAVRGYIYDWDSFSLDRGKNGYFYRRPTDGRFMFLHWDSDLAFQSANAEFYAGMPGFTPYLTKAYNFRLFKHYLSRMLEAYTLDSARVYAWLQAEEDASTQYSLRFAYKTWFASRKQPALSFVGTNESVVFTITTNGGNTISTSGTTQSLAGIAPLRVFKVEVEGHPEAQSTWASENTWNLTGILLHTGANVLTVNGVDEFGAILEQDSITVNKTGNAPPVMAITANPSSWQVSVLDQVTLDASGSHDPDGGPLTYSWSATGSGVSLDAGVQDVATATFSHPGLYTFTVTGQDAGGGSATIQREAAVYGPDGFSPFDLPHLDPFWTLENVVLRPNTCVGSYYSLTEVEGTLVLHVWGDRAVPLGAASHQYPLVWRSVPSLTDWAFLARLDLRGQVFGDYTTGVLAEMQESGSPVRYAFGIEHGTLLIVRRITASGTVSVLKSTPWNVSGADVRIRRAGDKLLFEQRTSEVWTAVHSVDAARNVAAKVGMFIATDTPQTVKVAFDYAILVDPNSGG